MIGEDDILLRLKIDGSDIDEALKQVERLSNDNVISITVDQSKIREALKNSKSEIDKFIKIAEKEAITLNTEIEKKGFNKAIADLKKRLDTLKVNIDSSDAEREVLAISALIKKAESEGGFGFDSLGDNLTEARAELDRLVNELQGIARFDSDGKLLNPEELEAGTKAAQEQAEAVKELAAGVDKAKEEFLELIGVEEDLEDQTKKTEKASKGLGGYLKGGFVAAAGAAFALITSGAQQSQSVADSFTKMKEIFTSIGAEIGSSLISIFGKVTEAYDAAEGGFTGVIGQIGAGVGALVDGIRDIDLSGAVSQGINSANDLIGLQKVQTEQLRTSVALRKVISDEQAKQTRQDLTRQQILDSNQKITTAEIELLNSELVVLEARQKLANDRLRTDPLNRAAQDELSTVNTQINSILSQQNSLTQDQINLRSELFGVSNVDRLQSDYEELISVINRVESNGGNTSGLFEQAQTLQEEILIAEGNRARSLANDFEVIGLAISEIERNIANTLASGGVVRQSDIELLRSYEEQVEGITRETESLKASITGTPLDDLNISLERFQRALSEIDVTDALNADLVEFYQQSIKDVTRDIEDYESAQERIEAFELWEKQSLEVKRLESELQRLATDGGTLEEIAEKYREIAVAAAIATNSQVSPQDSESQYQNELNIANALNLQGEAREKALAIADDELRKSELLAERDIQGAVLFDGDANEQATNAALAEIQRIDNELKRVEQDQEVRRKTAAKATFDLRLDQFKQAADLAIELTSFLNEERLKRLDFEIDIQERRVSELNRIVSDGNAEQLQLEENRLDELLAKREDAIRRQQQLASVEAAISQGLTVAKGIQAIVTGAVQGGPIGVALQVAAVLAGIASITVGLNNAFTGVQGFYEGTEWDVQRSLGKKSGKDSHLVRVDNVEKIVGARDSMRVAHMPTKKMVDYALLYEAQLKQGKLSAGIPETILKGSNGNTISARELTTLVKQNKTLISQNQELKAAILQIRPMASIDENGFEFMATKKAKRNAKRGDRFKNSSDRSISNSIKLQDPKKFKA